MRIMGSFYKKVTSELGLRKRHKQKEQRFGRRGEKGPFPLDRIAWILDAGEAPGKRSEGKWPGEGAEEREANEGLSMELLL